MVLPGDLDLSLPGAVAAVRGVGDSVAKTDSNTARLGCGCTPGSLVAAFLSYVLNDSLGWAILHGLLGWLYVFYAVIWRAKEIMPALKAWFA